MTTTFNGVPKFVLMKRIRSVYRWCKENKPDIYNDGERWEMFRAAYEAGVITMQEYNAADEYYSDLFGEVPGI